MKKIILSAIMTVFALGASAQMGPISFGVKGGVMADNIKIEDGGKSGTTTLSSDPNMGWQVGIVSRINLAIFHIQPEILYNMHSYDFASNTGGDISRADVSINTVDVPVLAGLRFLMLRFQAGPVFNLMTDTKVKNNTGENCFIDIHRPSVSFAVGVGVDVWNLNFDVRYNGNFTKVEQDITVGDGASYNYDSKFDNFAFSVAYMF